MFWMVCDELTCGVARMKQLDLSKSLVTIGSDNRPRLMREGQKEFCEEASKEGWLVALNMMLCPGHHQQRLAEEKVRTQSRILAPTPGATEAIAGARR
jgi:hypothetical protein